MLKGQLALVTGGSSGYGKAAAQLLAQEGCRVLIAARGEEALKKAKDETGSEDYLVMDVTKSADWADVRQRILARYGRLDILINNAGGGVAIKPIAEQSVAEMDACVALNLQSALYGCNAFAPVMKAQRGGTIINVSSVCAKHAWPGWSVYAAAKWGLHGLSKGLYVELRPYNVRVTCVVPAAGSAQSTNFRQACDIPPEILKLQAQDVGRVIRDICALPPHVVIEETTVWGIDQEVNPL